MTPQQNAYENNPEVWTGSTVMTGWAGPLLIPVVTSLAPAAIWECLIGRGGKKTAATRHHATLLTHYRPV